MTLAFNIRAVVSRILPRDFEIARSFPRDIEAAAQYLPVYPIHLDELTPRAVDAWLSEHLGWVSAESSQRSLRGCLVAHRGRAFIFLDAAETTDERRFTLSHELSHFVGHYLMRRDYAIAQLGAGIMDVLNGVRPPTKEERLSSVLKQCPLGTFRDVLARDGLSPVNQETERMECEADAAAFEIIAPAAVVVAECKTKDVPPELPALQRLLVSDFGLALTDAKNYAPAIIKKLKQPKGDLLSRLREAAQVQNQRGETERSLGSES